jgi:hypothetical protein
MVWGLLWAALGCDDGATASDAALVLDSAVDATPDAVVADAVVADAAAPDAMAPDAMAPDAGLPTWACATPGALDDQLALNHVISLGSHNSYHLQSEQPVDDSHRYDHPPLDAQLEHGVRQFELDLHWEVERGLVVFHLPVLDPLSTCDRFSECLTVIRRWSIEHPCHVPIVIWMEFKDGPLDVANPAYETFLDRHDAVEAEILSVWPREHLLTPDDLRGDHPDLPTAIRADGWPTLARTRGTLLFALLDGGAHREAYLAASPVLADRLMFVDSDAPTDVHAATFKINNAATSEAQVRSLVEAGFLVTSNVDGAGRPADERQAHFDDSLAVGPHHLSTDFVLPDPVSGYVAELPEGPTCHPQAAPEGCTAAAVEPR